MISKTISHYKILEKLGGGDMGVVYKAQDLKLDRPVALKFLPPDLTRDDEAKERFVHEARAASKLQHNNICAIHEIDETEDGQIFISMDCYEGETLKEKIKRGPLDIDKAVDIAIQIAMGLEKAHQKEIVHRDMKPANVLITEDGVVKILDFGLAKLTDRTKITKTCTTVGTVAYMSPEQTRGDDVDCRSDIWSLGVVLYEMISGRLPFKGEHEQAVIYSILNEEIESLTDLKNGVPLELKRIVGKALIKKPDERYQNIKQILVDLKSLGDEIKSWTLKSTESETKQVPSIAVLPFVDMSPEKDQEYFCDGMAEEIINALSHIENLHVISRTSVFVFKGMQMDVRQIGKKLDVEILLEGSVRKAENRLRITVQLVKVSDGFHLWSERYDRDIKDVFAIQDEIAQNIVQSLKLKLSQKEKRVLEKVATKDFQAYDYYLRGRKFFYRADRKSVALALDMFSKAIKRDSGYALAYAGIADCHSWLFMYLESTKENLKQAINASEKALEIDNELA
jgi:serine/threonine protein kinase